MNNIDRAAIVVAQTTSYGEAPVDECDMEVAQALADAGLLTPDVRVIHTLEDLKALDPDTALTLYTWEGATIWEASYFQKRFEGTGYIPELPAVVIATGEQVRAAREALEEEK